MHGGPRLDVADVIGMMLENIGMRKHDTTATLFEPAKHGTLDELVTSFGEFVRQNAPPTEYALCVEFVGTPQTGAQEVRTVLVDHTGKAIWTDAQTPADSDFKRLKPGEPMTCCLLVAERLKPVFHLAGDAGKPVREGRWAQRWQQRSGTPSEAEYAAMKERATTFKQAGATARVLIYPARISNAVDRGCATHLAALLTKAKLCAATVADAEPSFDIKGSPNEQRMLWDFARAVQEYVKANPADADYVLFSDYMMARPNKAGAVHFVVCSRAGEWVIVDYQNDHHADFKRIEPKSTEDCDQLVATRLTGYLR
jgi:hypothetical protein